jgi:hypothetical protein
MAKSSNRGGRNNNPSGRNQYSGVMEMARDRPFAAAATAAGAAAAGLFLWSRRAQIGDQLNNLSDQFSEWRSSMESSGDFQSSGNSASRETSSDSNSGEQGSGSGTAANASNRGRTKSQQPAG